MKLKRDYEKISYQCFFEYDEALEKDLMDDTPDFDLTQLVEYFINHSYDYKGEEMVSGFGTEIERMVGITDEQVEWFCQEYAEYEHWSVVFYNYFHTNPHHYNIEDVWLKAGDNSHDMDLIFVYYHTKCKPRLTLKRGSLQNAASAKSNKINPPQTNPSDSIDTYILVKNKEAFKAMMTRLLKGKKGKNAASLVYGAVQNGYMQKPTFSVLQSAFGITGAKQGFDKYYNDKRRIIDEDARRAVYTIKCQYEDELEKIALP